MSPALAGAGGGTLFPATTEALAQRNDRLCELSVLPAPAHSALTLSDFEAWARY